MKLATNRKYAPFTAPIAANAPNRLVLNTVTSISRYLAFFRSSSACNLVRSFILCLLPLY